MRIRTFTLAFALLAAWPGWAQDKDNQQPAAGPDQMPTFRKNVNLVNLFFNVKDKHGGFVPGLTPDQFELTEDGKRQTIKYFSAETNQPLTLGIMIDSSKSMELMLPEEKIMTIRGRSVITGLPESVDISSIEVREAMSGSVSIIVDLVKAALDETPPEVVADLMEQGIALAGGGALLQGLAQRLSEEVKVRVWVAPDPLTAVAIGCGQLLENLDTLRAILQSVDRSRRRVITPIGI